MKAEQAEIVLEEARRALDQQQQVLDNLRSRTGTLLTAASIASTFLGGLALSDGGFSVFSALAIVALLAVGWFAIRKVLWPRQSAWTFSHNVPALVSGYLDATPAWSVDEMRLAIAKKNQEFWDNNAVVLDEMFSAFRLAATALLAEVVFWLLDLGICG